MKNKKMIPLVIVFMLIVLGVASIGIVLFNTRDKSLNDNKKMTTIKNKIDHENTSKEFNGSSNDNPEKKEEEQIADDTVEKEEPNNNNNNSVKSDVNSNIISNNQQSVINNNVHHSVENNNSTSQKPTNEQQNNIPVVENKPSVEVEEPIYTIENDIPADSTLVKHRSTEEKCWAYADTVIQQHEDNECINGCRPTCIAIYGKYTNQIIGYMLQIRIQDGVGTLLSFKVEPE